MVDVLKLLGGLGVFLFGLRVMSNGLQKVAGHRLRAVLAGMTKNRFSGIFSGFTLTTAVQSSSATTVLAVSFANAGLLSLTQAIGIVMGANIGTTVTLWLVALLGFKVKIASFALPIIGIAFPLSLLKNNRAKQLSEVFVGFGLLFMGLKFLKDGVPDLRSSPETLEFLVGLADYGFASILLFVVAGTILTIVVQSSSAATTITVAMAAKGWIGFDLAAAMVLGENIGTTITATLAALGANNTAKRVARAHTLFNLLGVAWMIPCLFVFLRIVDSITPGDPVGAELPSHLAVFHTAFNVTNTLILMWFVKTIERVVRWWVPLDKDEDDTHHLQFLETGLLGTPELAGVEARRGLQQMSSVCDEMFGHIKKVLGNPTQKLGSLVDEIKRGEAKTDQMEEEIVAFCSQLARVGSSAKLGRDIAIFLDMANDIERMGDHCFNLILLGERRYEKRYKFGEPALEDLTEMMTVVGELLHLVPEGLAPDAPSVYAEAKLLESKINKLRDQARKHHAKRMQDGDVGVRDGLIFLDMMTNMEKLGDYAFNVAKASDQLREQP